MPSRVSIAARRPCQPSRSLSSTSVAASVSTRWRAWRSSAVVTLNSATQPIATTETTNTRVCSSAKRKPVLRRNLEWRTEHVPRAADRLDELGIKPLVDLGTQPADMRLDDVGPRVEVEIPDILQQHRARHDPPGVAHQVLEQAELAGLKIDPTTGPAHLAPDQVHLKVGHLEHGLDLGHGRPARERGDACQQLGKGEGLDEVVVAPSLQSLHPIAHAGHGGQEQNRRFDARSAYRLDDAEAVQARQPAVDDHDLVGLAGCQKEAVAAVGRYINHVPLLFQTLLQIGACLGIVLNDEQLHSLTPSSPLREITLTSEPAACGERQLRAVPRTSFNGDAAGLRQPGCRRAAGAPRPRPG